MVGPEVRGPLDLTSTGRATPARDSNLHDPAQVIEIMEIPTTCERPVYRAPARTNEDRTRQLEAVEELGLMRSDWLGGRDSLRISSSSAGFAPYFC
jgi:hypothetical protein